MTDIYSVSKRSEIMRKVKGANTKPEILVRKYLFKRGFRFRLHQKKLPGTPDIVLKKYNTAIFINGCFWHGHQNCKRANLPKTNYQFWNDKIKHNKYRDEINRNKMTLLGWRVLTVYECDLAVKKIEATMSDIVAAILAAQ